MPDAGKQPLADCPPCRLASVSLFLSDMDGTWLSPGHEGTDHGRAAIAEAEAHGLTFCFATGRCPASASGASGMPLHGRPGIYSNGSIVLGKGGKELLVLDLPADVYQRTLDLGQEAGVAVLPNDRDNFHIADPAAPMALHLHEVYHDPYPLTGCPPSAQLVHLVGTEEAMDRLEPRLRAAIGADACVARNLPTDLVVSHLDASKGQAARRLAAAFGLEIGTEGGCSQVLAIGDSGNDVSMLATPGVVGVAMANARPAAMEAAEFVTRGSNGDVDLPGVLEAVQAVCAAKVGPNLLQSAADAAADTAGHFAKLELQQVPTAP